MARIEFTKDFANRKKGSKWDNCPSILASRLVNNDKVAKFFKETKAKKKEQN